jgi:hypothetical protein
MVRDEAAMLHRWIDYYGGQLGLDHLVVVDDHSRDGSTEGLPVRVVQAPVLEEGAFERSRMRVLSALASDLLRTHDAVLLADCDEFLVADPDRFDGLVELVAADPEREVFGGLGFNVVHRVEAEPALEPSAAVLGQRSHGFFVSRLCKPSLKRTPARWRFASHGIDAAYVPDPALVLFHLKYADADLLRAAGDQRLARHASTGLGPGSAWARSGAELVADLTGLPGVLGGALPANGPGAVPEFDPSSYDAARLVRSRGASGESWEADGVRELTAMQAGPLLRVPSRFIGMV